MFSLLLLLLLNFGGGLNFNHSPRDSKDSFLCWLYGDPYKTSPSLEDQDNQTPPHQSLGSIQSLCGRSLFANSPYSAVPSYTHRYAHVRSTHTYTHTQSHSATSQARGLKEHIKSFMVQRWKLRLGKKLPKFSNIWDPTHVHTPAKPPLCKWGNWGPERKVTCPRSHRELVADLHEVKELSKPHRLAEPSSPRGDLQDNFSLGSWVERVRCHPALTARLASAGPLQEARHPRL